MTWSIFISSFAALLSIIALIISIRFSKRNIRLNIQQAIFKIVSDKAKDCNNVWNSPLELKEPANSPHFNVMTELIISKEVIDKSFHLFGKNQSSIKKFKNDYYYLLYKQLTPNLRGWLRKSPEIADRLKKEFNEPNLYFDRQTMDIFSVLERYFEPIL